MTDEKSPNVAPGVASNVAQDNAPAPAPSGQPAKPLSAEQQWELAMAFLRRADEAANYLRTLLFAASGGFAIYLLPQLKAGDPGGALWGRVLATASTAVAIFLLVYSWQLQKRKARERFDYLRDGNYDAYILYNKPVLKNSSVDWFAFLFLAVAFLIEVLVRVFSSSISLNV